MVYYTTSWAKKIKNPAQYQEWLGSLKDGDRCLFQEFIPRGNSCLDSQVEHWRFWNAGYHVDRVFYDNETRPIKDGICVYWNSDEPWGRVFDARIVPWHHDIAPEPGFRFKQCHTAAYEPALDDADRCLVLLPDEPGKHEARAKIRQTFPRQYDRDVNEGSLYTIFADYASVEEFCKDGLAQFLYSEPTR